MFPIYNSIVTPLRYEPVKAFDYVKTNLHYINNYSAIDNPPQQARDIEGYMLKMPKNMRGGEADLALRSLKALIKNRRLQLSQYEITKISCGLAKLWEIKELHDMLRRIRDY